MTPLTRKHNSALDYREIIGYAAGDIWLTEIYSKYQFEMPWNWKHSGWGGSEWKCKKATATYHGDFSATIGGLYEEKRTGKN